MRHDLRDAFRAADAFSLARAVRRGEANALDADRSEADWRAADALFPARMIGAHDLVYRPERDGVARARTLEYRPERDGPAWAVPVSARPNGDFIDYDPPGDDTPPFRTPRPKGFDQEIGPGRGYHEYRADASTPGDDRIHEEIRRGVIRNPVPGPNDRAASPGGVQNDAGLPFVDDQVQSYLTTDEAGNTVVVNLTRPGEHALDPGYVAQYVVRTPEGTRVIVAGEGMDWKQWGPGSEIGEQVFGAKIRRDVRRGVFNSTRR